MQLTAKDIRMNAHAANKDEALAVLGGVLVEDALTTPEYLQGLKDREAQSATYLGQGIAIPHGTPASRDAIMQTGVRLVHFADGVVWNDEGDVVYLAAVIAAKSDEHLQVLKQLTKVLSDDVSDKVKSAKTPKDVLAIIQGVPLSFLLHENLIKQDDGAKDSDALYFTALNALKSSGVINGISALSSQSTSLVNNIRCITIQGKSEQINQSALAIAIAKENITPKAVAVVVANEHLDAKKLSQAYDAMLDDEFATAVDGADTANIIELLGAESSQSWVAKTAIILNEHGLHARPATALSSLAKEANGEIKVAVDDGFYVSAKSLSRLLSLGAVRGQTLKFIAEPDTDAVAHLDKLTQAVADGLGESVQALAATTSVNEAAPIVLDFSDKASPIVKGEKSLATTASSGLAVGEAHVVRQMRFEYPATSSDPKAEFSRLMNAIEVAKQELSKTISHAKSAAIAKIFTAHLALLEDEEITFGAKDGIDDGLSAEAAWHAHIETMAKLQSSVANHLLAERAADLRDVGQKVLSALTGQKLPSEPDSPYVLIKEDLMPSDVASLDPARVAGILTAVGGASSHSAIVARALGIPALVGAGAEVLNIDQGAKVLMNAGEGWFVVEPSEAQIESCQKEQLALKERKRIAHQHAHEPAITQDGHRVEVAVNLGNVDNTKPAVDNGAEAVGLLRTELVFMAHRQVPDIDTQIRDYEKVFDALEGRPLVVRTLDVGGDKPLPYLPMPSEDNPFLGVRGIRLTLKQPELLKNQLIALIRASKGRDLRIMFPMVGQLEEWTQARAILDEVLAEYPHDNLQVGIMIEVPSAAIIANAFAKEVDFFSIGTNDLTQYTLAIDRGHPILSKDADGLHPSILTLIDHTVKAAHAHGKWVGVCGELAGDEKAVPILMGLGVDELSMSVSSIALVKDQIRGLNLADCQYLAKRALACQTASDVRALTDKDRS